MKNLKIARRYAMALLLIGVEDGQVDKYREELSSFAHLMATNPQFAGVVENPVYESAGRKSVLEKVLEKAGYAKPVQAFLNLLFDKGRISNIAAISEVYDKLADEQKGIARASLTTAADLSGEAVEKIRQSLSRRTGKTVVLTVEKDPELIGGVVARIGDLVLDGSVRTQLQNMKESLTRSEAV
ncbi:MAG: F0F1 ATP synthase subunit delta [Thermodesulfobacteriota bacterium]